MNKFCALCGNTKEISSFYRRGDSYRNVCKECTRNLNRERYGIEYHRKWRETNPEKVRDYSKRHYHGISKEVACRRIISFAVKAKIMIVPTHCLECNIEEKLEAHHPDYSKPLDVRWLCKKCHGLTRRT